MTDPDLPSRNDATGRERLAAWLAEWELDRVLAETEAHDDASPPGPMARIGRGTPWVTPFEPRPPVPGEIRLMSPPEAADPPLALAVLDMEGEVCRVAPFGRFRHPAVPAELRVDPPQPWLRVLCLWNVRARLLTDLVSSWPLGHLSTHDLGLARELLDVLESDGEVPEALHARTGPPLRHPMDPRREYLREERRRVDRGFPDAVEAGDALADPASAWAPEHLAAETPAVYGAPVRFRVEGRPLRLEVWPGPDPESRLLRVTDLDGHPSSDLDGGEIRAEPDGPANPIRDAWAPIPAAGVRGDLLLVHRGGRVQIRAD